MDINSVSNVAQMTRLQTLSPTAVQKPQVQQLDNDGDNDHGAPDAVKGQHIDIKA